MVAAIGRSANGFQILNTTDDDLAFTSDSETIGRITNSSQLLNMSGDDLAFKFDSVYNQISPTFAPSLASQCNIGCPNSPDVENGFATIADLRCEMQKDLQRAKSGLKTSGPFVYRLCPDTVYDLSNSRIEPTLNDTHILCGASASSADKCIVSGGKFQSIIFAQIPEGNPLPLDYMRYQGITFADHADEGDDLSASFVVETGLVEVIDCHWKVSFRVLNISDHSVFVPH